MTTRTAGQPSHSALEHNSYAAGGPEEVIGVGKRTFGGEGWASRLRRAALRPDRIVSHFLRRRGYRQAWDHLGKDRRRAYEMVDTSHDEEELTRRGRDVAERLADALLLTTEHTVLEIGCGPARIGREMASRCREWVGADISREMIRLGRQRTAGFPNVRFVELLGADLGMLQDRSFDRVYCHSVLVHIDKEDLYRYLREIARVLKPKGVAYVDTWSILHEDSWRWFETSVRNAPLAGRKEVWRPQFATAPELRHLLERAGLAEVILAEESHLLQAFCTVAPQAKREDVIASLRRDIEPRVPRILGLD